MEVLRWRALVAVMWLLQVANYAAYILITMLENPALEPSTDGILVAVFFFIPCVLAWLTFVAPPASTRWAHIAFGAVFFLLKAAAAAGLIGESSPAVYFNEAWAAAAAALLIWYAWQAPEQPAR